VTANTGDLFAGVDEGPTNYGDTLHITR